MVVVAPDAGRVKVAERFSQHLGADLALVHKTPAPGPANEVEARDVIGDVEGRHCVLIDDMIDTAGTICAAAELPGRGRCGRHLGHGHPRRALGPGASTG